MGWSFLVTVSRLLCVGRCRSLSVGRYNLFVMLVDYFVRSVIGRSQRVGRRGLVAVGSL